MNSLRPTKTRFPYSYSQCESKLTDFKTGRHYRSKNIAANTLLEAMPGGDFKLWLYHTDVLTIHDEGYYTLNYGDWPSNTTFDRLSAFCPLPVVREGNKWFVWTTDAGGHMVPFKNGMVVHESGKIVHYPN